MPAAGFGAALAHPADTAIAHRPAANAARERVAIHPPIGCIVQHPAGRLGTSQCHFVPAGGYFATFRLTRETVGMPRSASPGALVSARRKKRYRQKMAKPEREILTAAGREVAISNPRKVLFPQ